MVGEGAAEAAAQLKDNGTCKRIHFFEVGSISVTMQVRNAANSQNCFKGFQYHLMA